MNNGYWPNMELDGGTGAINGYNMNLSGRIALVLIEKWGAVNGYIRDKEDSAGRAVLDVMPVEDVVERACSMGELFVRELERREWIKPVSRTPEEVGKAAGRVRSATYRSELSTWKGEKKDK